MHRASDTLARQQPHYLIAPLHANRVDVKNVLGIWPGFGGENLFNLLESPFIMQSVRASQLIASLQIAQLNPQNRALNAIHAAVPADYRVMIFPSLPMIPKHTDLGLQLVVVSHDRASLAESSQVFARVEAKTTCVPEGSCPSALVFGAVGLSRVLNHEKFMEARKLEDWIHVCHLAEQVHWNDGFGPRCENGRQMRWVHRVGAFFHINENGCSAAIGNSLRRGHERTWDGDDFVSGTNTAGEENQPKRLSPAAEADGISAVAVGSEVDLEQVDEGASRKSAGLDHLPDSGFEFSAVGSVVRFEIEEWYFHAFDDLAAVLFKPNIQ